MNRIRKTVVVFLALCLALCSVCIAFAYSFTDISGHWSRDFVEDAYKLGVVKGYNDGSFRPAKDVSYQEAATMICNTIAGQDYISIDLDEDERLTADLEMLGCASWAKGYISCILNTGASVSDFIAPGSSSPASAGAQRQVIGAWAADMLGLPVSPLCVPGFSDSDAISSSYLSRICALRDNEIMGGYSDGSFRPSNTVSRGEFATVCVNMVSAMEKLRAKDGNRLLDDSLFLESGSIQGFDAAKRTLSFSFGDGPYYVPEDAVILIDGKLSDFDGLIKLGDSFISVSYLKGLDSALIIQTRPAAYKGRVVSAAPQKDFCLTEIELSPGLCINFVMTDIPEVGSDILFISQGAEIIEAGQQE